MLKLAGYYQINDSVLVPMTTVGTLNTALAPTTAGSAAQTTTLTQSVNAGTSHGAGGEIQLAGQNAQGIRWDASYSLAVTTDSSGIVLANGDLDKDSTPKHHLRLLLGYTTGPWEWDVNGQYQTSYFSHRGTDINLLVDDYSSVALRLAYRLTDHYTVALTGTNLAQSVTRTTAFPAIQRQAYLSLTGRF
jgi:iron complex outermembrane receptor protein